MQVNDISFLMDFLAHGLWSYIAGYKTKKPTYAVFFGLFPDLMSWFVYILYRLLVREEWGKPVLGNIPKWVFWLYGVSHSVIIVCIVFLLLLLFFKKIPIYLWTWPLHIFMDIPTHARNFLPTPFLWPLSTWTFPGISWGTPWFMIFNYTAITISLMWIFSKKKK